MVQIKLKEGEWLFKQGADAESFFLIQEGEVSVWVGNNCKKILGVGMCFGERSLLFKV